MAGKARPSFFGCRLEANHAPFGGGVSTSDSSASFDRCTFTGNEARYEVATTHSVSEGNFYDSYCTNERVYGGNGGGVLAEGPEGPSFTMCTLEGNSALSGGGFYGVSVSVRLEGSTLNENSAAYKMIRTIWELYDYETARGNHNLEGLDDSNLLLEPGFVAYSGDRNPDNDDFHLSYASPLRDAGTPGEPDPDGSPAELGAFGGPDADQSYYQDEDQDGLLDGWERHFGLNTGIRNAGEDPDNDGLTNAREQEVYSDPTRADTDRDGYNDGEEQNAGSSPVDWYDQPGVSGGAVARVPEDFATIQEAIDAVREEGSIQVRAGTWTEHLTIQGKRARIAGTGSASDTVVQNTEDGLGVMTVLSSEVFLQGLTVRGGSATQGGSSATQGGGSATQDGGSATQGGGSATQGGSSATQGGGSATRGGGIRFSTSEGTLEDLIISSNTAQMGGGLALWNSNITLSACRLSQNTALRGGGLLLDDSTAELIDSTLRDNRADPEVSPDVVASYCYSSPLDYRYGEGGGLYAAGSSQVSLRHSVLEDNISTGFGAGMYLEGAAAVLDHCELSGNQVTATRFMVNECEVYEKSYGGQGGAIYLERGGLEVSGSVVAGNSAELEGGGLIWESATPSLTHSIVAYNAGYNLYAVSGTADISWSDIFAPSGWSNHNLSGLESSVLTVEPGFLVAPVWDDETGTWFLSDFHLALDSLLVDAGNPALRDADGSVADPGIYGGPDGALWDRDQDGYFDYFWPGLSENAPEGFDPAEFDSNDEDPERH